MAKLHRFKKGNKFGKGRPKGGSTLLIEYRKEIGDSLKDGDVAKVFMKLMALALAGDLAAIRTFLEYTVGKPRHEVNITTSDGENLFGIDRAELLKMVHANAHAIVKNAEPKAIEANVIDVPVKETRRNGTTKKKKTKRNGKAKKDAR